MHLQFTVGVLEFPRIIYFLSDATFLQREDIKMIGFLDNLFVLAHPIVNWEWKFIAGESFENLGRYTIYHHNGYDNIKIRISIFRVILATTAFNINECPKIWQMNKLFSDKLTYGHMLDHSLIQSQQTKKFPTEKLKVLQNCISMTTIRYEIYLNWYSTVYINTAGLHVHLHEVQTANYVSACRSCSSCRAGCSSHSAWRGHATQQPGGGISLCYRYRIEL